MSDTETLRRGAEKLRGLATAATLGPWRATPYGDGPTQSWYVTGRHTLITTGLHEDLDDAELVAIEHDRTDAEYIAAVNPAAGLLLADWLDAEADAHDSGMAVSETLRDMASKAGAGEHHIQVAASTLDQALAVARALLGETEAAG